MRWWRVVIGSLTVGVMVSGWLLVRPRLSADAQQSAVTAASQLQPNGPGVAPLPTLTETATDIRAGSAVVLDAGSGQLLLAKDAHRRVPIASTTKVMSSIVFLASHPNLDTTVTVDRAAASQIGSLMGIAAGERISLRGLLDGALLVSGNDAIYALAEQSGGVSEFVNRMNQTAGDMALVDTKFYDPAGLDDHGTSSAADLAQMFRYALTFEPFRSVVASPSADVVSSTDTYHLSNSNRLVHGDEPLYFPDSIGGKTGFTPDAGHCLVAAARRNGHLLIVAVLASDDTASDGSAREARRLLSWSFDHTRWQ